MAASDFTNERVEAFAPTQNAIRYTYAGAGNVTLWRSTNGGAYASIISIPSDYGSYPSPLYDNVNVTPATSYAYKLSDDAGSTFSDIVTVVSMTEFQLPAEGSPQLVLPAFPNAEDINPVTISELRDKIESHFNAEVATLRRACTVCPVNGAIVLDCSEGCYFFEVLKADVADINSISINCTALEINFDIPADTPTEVCGFPEDVGFTGDECFQAPLSGPVHLDIRFAPTPDPCEQTRYRYPTFPCEGEFTKDCYQKGSLSFTGNLLFNFTLVTCGGGTVSGCCNGNQMHWRGSSGFCRPVVCSGDEAWKTKNMAHPLCGISILYGKDATPVLSPPYDQELTIPGFGYSHAVGKPIYGVAINVTTTSTYQDFTGLVLLANHRTGLVILGQYTNADLRTGDMPTIINSAALPSNYGWFYMANFPSVADGTFELFDVAGSTTVYHFHDAGHTAPSTELLGGGLIWVANPDYGLHTAEYNMGSSARIDYVGV